MPGRSPTQLLDIHLVEERRIEESYFQDYVKVHERLERMFEKSVKPLPPSEGDSMALVLAAWLSVQAEKNVPAERLTMLYRCGLGHICVELCFSTLIPPEAVALAAYEEMKRRSWVEAVFDPVAAALEAKRLGLLERKAHPKPVASTNASDKTTVAKRITRKEDREMSNIDEAGKATVVPEQNEAAKKPEAEVKKPVAKKPAAAKKAPVAKKPAAKKPVAKKVAEKKAPAKKVVAKKPVAKKPVAKKVAAKKPVAKKVAAKKPVAKKAVAKKPVAKKVAAKKPAAKKVVAKKPVAKKVAAKPAAKKAVAKKPAAKKAPAKK